MANGEPTEVARKTLRRTKPEVCRWFVDEAGDGTIFNRHGKVLIGKEGCSRYFMLGTVEIEHPASLEAELAILRTSILNDRYFRNVPSLDPKNGKTASFFHAKDDLPEIRREVFRIIERHRMYFRAAIHDKAAVFHGLATRQAADPSYRYRPNDLYDSLVHRLCYGHLHQRNAYEICFAKRGKADRTAALFSAVERARDDYQAKFGVESADDFAILSNQPKSCVELQVVDYLLWALQRFYEREESRFIEYVWPKVKRVIDIDDTVDSPEGQTYGKKKPLSRARLQRRPGI